MHGDVHRYAIKRTESIDVISVIRLKYDDFVAGIEQRHAGRVKSARRTGRNHDSPFRITLDVVVLAHLMGNRATKIRHSVQARIRVLPRMDGLNRSPLDRLRDFGIADSLREIDAPHPLAFHRHDADLGLRNTRRFPAQLQHQAPLKRDSTRIPIPEPDDVIPEYAGEIPSVPAN